MKISRKEAVDLMYTQQGNVFSVKFIKKDREYGLQITSEKVRNRLAKDVDGEAR